RPGAHNVPRGKPARPKSAALRPGRRGLRLSGLVEAFRSSDTAEPCVVITHRLSRIVERRRRGSIKRARPCPTLELAATRAAFGLTPLPDVAAHGVGPIRADAALVAAH